MNFPTCLRPLASAMLLIAMLCGHGNLSASAGATTTPFVFTAFPAAASMTPVSSAGNSAQPLTLRLMTTDAAATVSADAANAGCIRATQVGVHRGRHYLLVEIAPACRDGRKITLQLRGAPVLRSPAAPPVGDEFERQWLAVTFDNYSPETDPGPDPALNSISAPQNFPAAFTGTRLRAEVRSAGVYRIYKSDMAAKGFVFPSGFTPAQFKLTHGGVEVAITPSGTFCNLSTCDTNYIEFYGVPLTGENQAGAWEGGDYTDAESYFLTTETVVAHLRTVALSGASKAFTNTPGYFSDTYHRESNDYWAPTSTPPGETHFFDKNGGTYLYGYPGAPSCSGTIKNCYPISLSPPTPSTTQPGTLTVLVSERGIHYNPRNPTGPFSVAFNLNGILPAAQPLDWTAGGLHPITLSFPGSALSTTGTSTLTAMVTGNSTSNDEHQLNWVEVDYNRTYTATANTLAFSLPNQVGQIQHLVLSGLTGGTTFPTLALYEITTPGQPRPVTSIANIAGSSLIADFDFDNSCGCSTRRFLLQPAATQSQPTPTGLWTADTLAAAPDPDLLTPAAGAKYLIVYHPDLIAGTAATTWNAFLARKQNQFGAANVRAIPVQDVYNEFSLGRFTPDALQSLLQQAMTVWPNPKPEYVLFLGDATVDTKDYLNRQAQESTYKNWVPTRLYDLAGDIFAGYFLSDAALADVNNDGLADLATGRIPARTPAETATLLGKFNSYDAFNFYPWSAGKEWVGRTVLSTDQTINNYDFEKAANDYAFAAPSPQLPVKLYYAQPPWNGNTTNSAAEYSCALRGYFNGQSCALGTVQNACGNGNSAYLKNLCICSTLSAVNAPYQTGLINFDGHGNQYLWGNHSLMTDFGDCRNVAPAQTLKSDPEMMTTFPAGSMQTPFANVFNCLSGSFATVNPGSAGSNGSLVEEMLKRSAGGLVGAIAPSSITDVGIPPLQMNAFQKALDGPSKIRDWGVLTQATRTVLPQTPAFNNPAAFGHIYFGDPAQAFKLPAPGAPAGLLATAGNGQVALSWIAPADVNTKFIRLWRAQQGNGGPVPLPGDYAPAGCIAATQTNYTDTGLVNHITYYYTLSGYDNYDSLHPNCSGFEGARAGSASAYPDNPFPPSAPTGMTVSDPGTGTSLQASFTPSPETDVQSYTLWWGTVSGSPTQSLNIGASTAAAVSGLTPDVRYYFSATATNSSGRTSSRSVEASGIPRQSQGGIRPPGASANLRVSKSAADLRVDWTLVNTDYFGDPLNPPLTGQTLFHYANGGYNFNVFTLPALSKAALTATTATYTDLGANASIASIAYLVMATNGTGDGSAGAALPRGITDLRAAKSTITPGRLAFSFTPVTLDTRTVPLPAPPLYWVYRSTMPAAPALNRTGTHGGSIGSLTGALCEGSTVRWCDDSDLSNTSSYFFSLLVEDARGNSSPW